MEYEELPLFIHRDFREVIVHADGHKPPLLKKEQTAPRLQAAQGVSGLGMECCGIAWYEEPDWR